jgi:hypothetical protein
MVPVASVLDDMANDGNAGRERLWDPEIAEHTVAWTLRTRFGGRSTAYEPDDTHDSEDANNQDDMQRWKLGKLRRQPHPFLAGLAVDHGVVLTPDGT